MRWSAPTVVARDLFPARASTNSYSSTDPLTKIMVKEENSLHIFTWKDRYTVLIQRRLYYIYYDDYEMICPTTGNMVKWTSETNPTCGFAV